MKIENIGTKIRWLTKHKAKSKIHQLKVIPSGEEKDEKEREERKVPWERRDETIEDVGYQEWERNERVEGGWVYIASLWDTMTKISPT